MDANQEAFHTLSYYTLSHPDKGYFIHQHIVDAYQAQIATEFSKPISILYALVGLYLFLEKGYTGRQVQLAHMQLSRNKQPGPQLPLPVLRGTVSIEDVLLLPEGNIRDKGIRDWCQSVWDAYLPCHKAVADFVTKQSV
ncbi:MAG TPA: DUF5946 family protein [Saprospiraceae bacterium]|nr:DUF5946 family protein [Saprospiraceae bacterium]